MPRQQDQRARRSTGRQQRARSAAVLAAASAGTPAPGVPGYLVFDDFNRADGPIGSAPTGQTWTILYSDETEAIINGEAHIGEGIALIDAGTHGVDIRLTLGSICNGNVWVLARANGDRGLYTAVFLGGTEFEFAQEFGVDGGGTEIHFTNPPGPLPGGVPAAAGDVLRVTLHGSALRAWLNDAELIPPAPLPIPSPGTYAGAGTYVGFADRNAANRYAHFTVAPYVPTVLLSDTFTRANGPVGSATTGQAWLELGSAGQAQIINNALNCGSSTVYADVGQATFDISAVIHASSTGGIRLAWHLRPDLDQQGSAIYFVPSTNSWTVELYFLRQDGSSVFVSAAGITGNATVAGRTPVPGDTIRVRVSSTYLTLYRNSTPLFHHPLTSDAEPNLTYRTSNYIGLAQTDGGLIDAVTVTTL